MMGLTEYEPLPEFVVVVSLELLFSKNLETSTLSAITIERLNLFLQVPNELPSAIRKVAINLFLEESNKLPSAMRKVAIFRTTYVTNFTVCRQMNTCQTVT